MSTLSAQSQLEFLSELSSSSFFHVCIYMEMCGIVKMEVLTHSLMLPRYLKMLTNSSTLEVSGIINMGCYFDMCVLVYVYMCVYVCTCVCMFVHVCMYVCLCVYVCLEYWFRLSTWVMSQFK